MNRASFFNVGSLFWVILIFLLAISFRVFFLNLMEFKYDEAWNFFMVNRFFTHPNIIEYGSLASIGVHNFPLFLYLLTFMSISLRDPQSLTFLIALSNSFVVALFYFLSKKSYGIKVALFGSVILATSPWAVLFSRKIWSPDLLMLLLVPYYYFVYRLLVSKKANVAILVFMLLFLIIQIHFSGIFLAIALLIVFVCLRVRLKYQYVLLGVLLAGIPAIPYFLYNLFSSPFCPECTALFSYISYSKSVRPFDFYNLIRPFQIITGLYFQNPLGKDYESFINLYPVVKVINVIFALEYTIPIVGSIFIFRRKINYLFLVIYFFSIPVVYLFTKTPSYMYYYIISLPVAAIIAGICFDSLLSISKNLLFRSTFVVGFILIVSANLVFEFCFYSFVSKKQVIRGDYGPVFSLTKQSVQAQIYQYSDMANFKQIESYAFMYPDHTILHGKLGDYFAQNNFPFAAIEEFQKDLRINPNDIRSRANLTYIYILTGDMTDAKTQLSILRAKNKDLGNKLQSIFNNTYKIVHK